VPLTLPATTRYRRPEPAPDGYPFCPDCHETGRRWRWRPQGVNWVGPCHCGRIADPPPSGWSTRPEPPPDDFQSPLDPYPGIPTRMEPHPVTVRHPFRHDEAGNRPLHGDEPYYPVCGCGWVGHPQQHERPAWDLSWTHAGIDWRSVPVQPEPRASRRPRRGQPQQRLPSNYRGPIPCHFGLVAKQGCGRGYRADQRDGVLTRHGCRGVIPPAPWRARLVGRAGEPTEPDLADRGEVCVCPCHLAGDEDGLPHRCQLCDVVLPPGVSGYLPCPSCAARLQRRQPAPADAPRNASPTATA
jgi:hypothetical protein